MPDNAKRSKVIPRIIKADPGEAGPSITVLHHPLSEGQLEQIGNVLRGDSDAQNNCASLTRDIIDSFSNLRMPTTLSSTNPSTFTEAPTYSVRGQVLGRTDSDPMNLYNRTCLTYVQAEMTENEEGRLTESAGEWFEDSEYVPKKMIEKKHLAKLLAGLSEDGETITWGTIAYEGHIFAYYSSPNLPGKFKLIDAQNRNKGKGSVFINIDDIPSDIVYLQTMGTMKTTHK